MAASENMSLCNVVALVVQWSIRFLTLVEVLIAMKNLQWLREGHSHLQQQESNRQQQYSSQLLIPYVTHILMLLYISYLYLYTIAVYADK